MTVLAPLVALALTFENQDVDDEFSSDVPEGPAQEALERARTKRQARQQEALGEQLIELLDAEQRLKKMRVKSIREHRRNIKRLKAQLDDGDRAMAYGHETSNYLPALFHYGVITHRDVLRHTDTHEQVERILQVPNDWEPSGS